MYFLVARFPVIEKKNVYFCIYVKVKVVIAFTAFLGKILKIEAIFIAVSSYFVESF